VNTGELPLPTSPHFPYSNGSSEDQQREVRRRNGLSILDHALLVVFYQTYDPKDDHTGQRPRRTKKGPINGPSSQQAPARPPADAHTLLQTITTPVHRFGFLFAMQILLTAEMPFLNFSRWVTNMSHSARKNRLNGWRYFYEYCEDTQT
jgi:hypothetical protein